jgi:hypothetical protein
MLLAYSIRAQNLTDVESSQIEQFTAFAFGNVSDKQFETFIVIEMRMN